MANELVTRQNLSLQAWIVPLELEELDQGVSIGGILFTEKDDPNEVLWYKTPLGTTVALGIGGTSFEDHYVTSMTLNGYVLTLGRNLGLADLTADLSSLAGGTGSTGPLYDITVEDALAITGGAQSVHSETTIGVQTGYQIPTTHLLDLISNHLSSVSGHLWVGQDLRTTATVTFTGLSFMNDAILQPAITKFTGSMSSPGSNSTVVSEQGIVNYVANVTGATGGDNLGNHIATQDLDMSSNNIDSVVNITGTGVVNVPNHELTISTVTDTYSGITVKMNFIGYMTIGQVVAFARAADASPVLAQANSISTMPAIGMLLETGTGDLLVLLQGFAKITTVYDEFGEGETLFLSVDVAGRMTTVVPSSTKVGFIQVLGSVYKDGVFYFNPTMMYLDSEILGAP